MKGQQIIAASIAVIISLGTVSCFTGVESTPRISDADVRKEKAAGVTAEQTFLSYIIPKAPRVWETGKAFKVTDSRISRIFSLSPESVSDLPGNNIYFRGFSTMRSMTGDDATEVIFSDDKGQQYSYYINGLNSERLDTLKTLDIPFTVDLDIVRQISDALVGKNYYIKTPAWYNPADMSKENGLRHIQVRIDSILPGDSYFPATVCFSLSDTALAERMGNKEYAVLMSVGDNKSATRNFDTLFSFNNPRKEHPEITNDIWALIISSKVKEGMTRDECRLALGTAPDILRTPSYSGMREVWSYSDGVFLIFEDGFLTRFRL